MNSPAIAEIAATAARLSIHAEPKGPDFFAAARAHGISKENVPAIAELAALHDVASREPSSEAIHASLAAERALEEGAQALVAAFAAATGKTGSRWAQSRQSHRRKLRKHGLDSDYAARLRAAIGA